MSDQNKNRAKRVRNLVAVCTSIAVVLSVSTYAWFIGMRTVNVSSFDVEIASTDSLLLSLDGSHWNQTVGITGDNYNDTDFVYENNTNNWGGRGLIPMSSIGDMDNTVSRMKLFEKASLTATPSGTGFTASAGGYRLLASRVHNYDNGNLEQDGYVAFDLFVKNFSGTQYLTALDPLDEEAIYLTNDSDVTVAAAGVANTGIENSVRVAFAQIGRVAGTTDTAATITGITCSDDANVTGICRTAQIWEPNDTKHVENAISWYETSCVHRKAADLTDAASYGGACGQVIDGKAYPTYAVSDDITSADKVDIYDGAAYNGYTAAESKLVSYPFFTDSMKFLTGTNRPTFMTLEPNSITKVRVYIYIEGQDIDNYDFASIGKRIAVKFGFTKERFTEADTQYNGPDLNQGEGPTAADKTSPVITLLGDSPMTLTVGTAYDEPGATANDNVDGAIVNADITKTGTVNTDVVGVYKVLYTAVDEAGNTGTKTRTINVVAE